MSWNSEINQITSILDTIETPFYPTREDVLRPFKYNFDDIKVVIIGQDCYHGEGQAMGLSFSVPKGIKIPPSLRNIYKELYEGEKIPEHGDLTQWAEQGVLLLNAALTVKPKTPGSHLKLWKPVTDNIIKKLSSEKTDLVFILWGNFAKKKIKLIDVNKHHILTSSHPSPLSANRGGWWGSKHFEKCNQILESKGKSRIKWKFY